MVLEQRRREQNGKRTTQAVAGQPDLLRHALAASRGGDEPPTNAAPMSYRCRGEGRIRNVLPPRHPRPMHDERYKTIFAFPRMVEDLLRGFAARDWAGELDFSTLRKVPAEYVSDTRLSRRGDAVWQLRFGDGRHLLVMLEFQSTDDPRMALRILAYTGLLYQELARNNAPVLDEHARLPAVLPVVLYNGAAPWKAEQEVGALLQPVSGALVPYRPSQRYHLLDERHVGRDDLPRPNLVTVVVWLEQSRSQWDLIPVTGMVWECLPSPEDGELRQVFLDWVLEILRRVLPKGETLPAEMTWEEMQMTLVERAAEWPKQWFREGRKEGREEVREEGLAHERALLRRMAASRFGADTADRLSGMLAGISDPERLAEVGEWLVRCDSGEEFLARVESHGPRDS